MPNRVRSMRKHPTPTSRRRRVSGKNALEFRVGVDIDCEQANVLRISFSDELHANTIEGRLSFGRLVGQETIEVYQGR